MGLDESAGTGNLFWASVASIADRTDNKEAYLHKNLVGNDLPFEIDPSCLLWNRLRTADRRKYARFRLLTAQKNPRSRLRRQLLVEPGDVQLGKFSIDV